MTRKKPGQRGNAGRPQGSPNKSVADRIRSAEQRIAKACYKQALQGDGQAALFCFLYAGIIRQGGAVRISSRGVVTREELLKDGG